MIKTLNSIKFRDSTVLVRIDVNSPYKSGKIIDNERIKDATITILELVKKKARVVLLAHQGRPGEEDFVHLDQHANLLSKHLKRNIKFVPDVIGNEAKSAIRSIKPGGILLLDNVRFVKDEEDEKKAKNGTSMIVKALSPLADFFVNDAFSVSHRAQASVMGFRIPSCFGRLMEKELNALENTRKKKKFLLVLGGAKSTECIDILEHNLSYISHAILSGITANIFLKASGLSIGHGSEKIIEEKKLSHDIELAKTILARGGGKIILPCDVAIESDGKRKEVAIDKIPRDASILDIGSKTIAMYEKIIHGSRTVIVKGPAGLYEDRRFRKGTKSIFSCVAASKTYSVMGGGDTIEALDELKINKKKISHISLGGGALIEYLSGGSMPGITAIMKK